MVIVALSVCSFGRMDYHAQSFSRNYRFNRNAPTIYPRVQPINPKPKRKPLGQLIGAFKTVSTKKINIIRNAPGTPVWQRNYYEHIIRNERALNNIRQYIINNPLSWHQDQLHPDNPSKW